MLIDVRRYEHYVLINNLRESARKIIKDAESDRN